MSIWIWPVEKDNWPYVKDERIWGVDTEQKAKFSKENIKKGDKIIFYIRRSNICFEGIYEVSGEWIESEREWADRETILEVGLKEIQTGFAHLPKFEKDLEAWQGMQVSRGQRGLLVKGTSKGPANSGNPISQKDCDIIAEEMKANPEGPPITEIPDMTRDTPEQFVPERQQSIRLWLVKALYENMLGPRLGPSEEVDEGTVWSMYPMGTLKTRHKKKEQVIPPADTEEREVGVRDDDAADMPDQDEDEKYSADQDLDPKLGIRSIGMSFFVKKTGSASPKINACFTWGRYDVYDDVPHLWRRKTNYYTAEIDLTLTDQKLKPTVNRAGMSVEKQFVTKDGVEIEIHSQPTPEYKQDTLNVTIFISNNTPIASDFQTPAEWVFQPQIRVNCGDGCTLTPLGSIADKEKTNEEMLYRDRRNFGAGHFCGVLWKDVDPEERDSSSGFSAFSWIDSGSKDFPRKLKDDFTRPDIRTEFIPTYTINQPDLVEKSRFTFDAEEHAEDFWSPSKLEGSLRQIPLSYKKFIETQEEIAASIDPQYSTTASENIAKCKKFLDRVNDGIDFLLQDEKARLAFCFMNKVMALKTKWDGGSTFAWWEFQMAFILQCLRSTATDNDKDVCDVLWFPTGGGKTEAYLGLSAFSMAYRRMGSFDDYNTGGVSVISRYTLRLLTLQQFKRSVSATVAADYLRTTGWIPRSMNVSQDVKDDSLKNMINKKTCWGRSGFSIGLWMGSAGTPNKFKDGKNMKYEPVWNAEGMLKALDLYSGTSQGEPAQIPNCPSCQTILAVPSSDDIGLEKDTNEIFWIFSYPGRKLNDMQDVPLKEFTSSDISAESFDISEISTVGSKKFYCIRISFTNAQHGGRQVNMKVINRWWANTVSHALAPKVRGTGNPTLPKLACASAGRPGYFLLRDDNDTFDFAIHCTNPKCDLNTTKTRWKDDAIESFVAPIGMPFKIDGKDGESLYMPILAYTCDYQVYRRCPSFLISTVDKFAMLPWVDDERDPASLFGNVNCHHKFAGYGRVHVSKIFREKHPNPSRFFTNVNPFLPPSLIIQDELHLIEGPLGSMVGIYETAFDTLTEQGGFKPKLVASSATVNEAEKHVGTVYRKNVSIFPPSAVSVEDSYFSESTEDRDYTDEKHGRLYLGICSATSPLVLVNKIWSTLLSEIWKMRQVPARYNITASEVEKDTDWYNTMIGYFNAKKELLIAGTLYEDDIRRAVNEESQVTFPSISYELPNMRLSPSLRFVPIKIEYGCKIENAAVYCGSRTSGKITVCLYKDSGGVPSQILSEAKDDIESPRVKKTKNGKNSFMLAQPYNAADGEMLWLAVCNENKKTVFRTGPSDVGLYLANLSTNEIEGVLKENNFPNQPKNIRKIPDYTVMASLGTGARELKTAIELTGETESQDLPPTLRKIETAPNKEVDAVLATSVFGTGIDISRLGLMAVMGQPKTTSSYIQSTGRIGRQIGGLVVTYLRAARVRDLNHYENFVGYHRILQNFVEPISASPYSEQALQKFLGAVSVAILRNARDIEKTMVSQEWSKGDQPIRMRLHRNDPEVSSIESVLKKKISSALIPAQRKPLSSFNQTVENTITHWETVAINLHRAHKNLIYLEWTINKPPTTNVVLGSEQAEKQGFQVVYSLVRTSMRDTEGQSNFGDEM